MLGTVRLAAFILTVLAGLAAAAGAETQLRMMDRYVVGFPMPIEAVVSGPVKDVPLCSSILTSNPIESLVLREVDHPRTLVVEGSASTLWADPALVLMPADPVPRISVEQGSTTRMTWDLSSSSWRTGTARQDIRLRSVDGGVFRVQGEAPLIGARKDHRVNVPAHSLVLLEPNEEEARFLRRVEAHGNGPRWRTFVLQAPKALDALDTSRFTPESRRQMQYVLLLQRLVHDPQPLEVLRVQDEEVAGLWSGFEIDVLELRYELACARAHFEDPAPLAEQIFAARPHRTEWLETTRRTGRGMIAEYRDLVKPWPKPALEPGKQGG